MADNLRDSAIAYHAVPTPGKIAITPTKPLTTQRDLSLAYSPGVASASEAIAADPAQASKLTARANMVAVITNGTAVLGLGAIGPLAAKPVMEGKAVLFKKFAGIDAIDIEINETDPDKLVSIIAALEPTFGGVNLEDIKAPECFAVEKQCRERMSIPVFHDDQHGTAIIVGAGMVNWMRLTGRNPEDIKVVTSGAGAAAMACLDLLCSLGIKKENVIVTDRLGVVYHGRQGEMDPRKAGYAVQTGARSLAEVMEGADMFLGVSVGGVLKPEMVATMAADPLIMALANPTPEIWPEDAKRVRPDAVIATGRSDYPNQVNNVLCFPFIFRGALDAGASVINEPMKVACVEALADLAHAEGSEIVASAYGSGDTPMAFGRDNLIPKPFDPRLIVKLAPAVAHAAMASGVADRPIADFDAYRQQLEQFVFRSGLTMKPVFTRAQQDPKRIVYAEGEEDRVLRAVQVVVDEGFARPVLVGRPDVIERRAARLGLRLRIGEDVEIVNPEDDPRYREYWTSYHDIMKRRGVTPSIARTVLRTNFTVIGALLVRKGEADALICGTFGQYQKHLDAVVDVLGLRPGIRKPAALSVLILSQGTYFVCDTYVTPEPDSHDIAENTIMAADQVRRFGITPKVALLSHSNFGTHDDADAARMRDALTLIQGRAPGLEVDGEMHADAALSPEIRDRVLPDSMLNGEANLFMMPSLGAANIGFNLLKVLGEGISIGPLLLGMAKPAHIITPSVTVRGIVNVSAVATVDAQAHAAARSAISLAE